MFAQTMQYNQVLLNVRGLRFDHLTRLGQYTTERTDYHLDQKLDVLGNEWYVFMGTNIGLKTSKWKNLEEEGLVELRGIVERSRGIFPIRSDLLLTDEQRRTPIATFSRGLLLCNDCSHKRGKTYPTSIPILPEHIVPFSQDCHGCGLVLIEIGRTQKGLDILFKKFIPPVIIKGKR